MTCDDAFDAMTDPQFPNPAALDQHLEGCPRCRQMREVLQPALALLAPADLVEERFDAGRKSPPAPFLTEELIAETERAANGLKRRAQPSVPAAGPGRSASARRSGTILLAALCALCALPFFASMKWAASVAPANAATCLWKDHNAAASESEERAPATSRQVVLTCMACHLPAAARP